MFRGTVGKLPGWLAALVVAGTLLSPNLARAQNFLGGGCATCANCYQPSTSEGSKCCQWHHCPRYYHCSEGPICLKFRCGCAKPVCNPCDLQNYGYTETCWSRGQWQSTCPVPPGAGPAALPHSAPLAGRANVPREQFEIMPALPEGGIRPGL